ncbi:MAG: SpoVR family protein [Chloroflexi bacterium]|nr:SpoVR family protein [Chloroflexota bacterium]
MTDQELVDLQEAMERIYALAADYKLDPFPIHWEVVPASIMYEFGAYGLPGRYSHWSHGKTYASMKTMYDYGLSRIYELVINTDPCYAFLMDTNQPIQNKLVVAHVIGHSDFFRHNAYFGHTNRKILETVSVHSDRIRQYEFQHGQAAVETFLDALLSIQEHIDPLAHRRPKGLPEAEKPRSVRVHDTSPYADLFALDARSTAIAGDAAVKRADEEDDLLLFLIEHARGLEDWQRDVLAVVREEMLYFLPQMQTKIMNEGWASLWHARILRELDLPGDEHTQFAALHAGVLSPSRRSLNPYYLGYKMWEHIERQANDGVAWTPEMIDSPGTCRIFDIRETESDVSFLRNYLDQDLVDECDLYGYRREGNEWVIIEKKAEAIRDQLVASMTTFGHPRIVVADADVDGHGELKLRHCFEGQELDIGYAEKTLEYVHRLWGRRVHLATVADDKPVTLSYDLTGGHRRG